MRTVDSFKARINNFAKERRINAQALLHSIMMERWLRRIAASDYRDNFILKGGMLIASLIGIGQRTTMDMDTTLRKFPFDAVAVEKAMTDICAQNVNDDTVFTVKKITAIREEDQYGGFRVTLEATYFSIVSRLKIDITADDAITPAAVNYSYLPLFENEPIEIWTYNIETVLAEKYQTIVSRGCLNTRARDFYDVYILLALKADVIDSGVLRQAVFATARRRATEYVVARCEPVLKELSEDAGILERWQEYRNKYSYASSVEFSETIDAVRKIHELILSA